MRVCVGVGACVQVSERLEKDIGSSEAEVQVVVSCNGCWELNSGPLQEQHEFLAAEPRLQATLSLEIYMYIERISFCKYSLSFLSLPLLLVSLI